MSDVIAVHSSNHGNAGVHTHADTHAGAHANADDNCGFNACARRERGALYGRAGRIVCMLAATPLPSPPPPPPPPGPTPTPLVQPRTMRGVCYDASSREFVLVKPRWAPSGPELRNFDSDRALFESILSNRNMIRYRVQMHEFPAPVRGGLTYIDCESAHMAHWVENFFPLLACVCEMCICISCMGHHRHVYNPCAARDRVQVLPRIPGPRHGHGGGARDHAHAREGRAHAGGVEHARVCSGEEHVPIAFELRGAAGGEHLFRASRD